MTPNFLIIGAEKAGTTWLYDRLRRHPNVFMPEVKEIHYFNHLNSNRRPCRNYGKHDLEWYEDHFRHRERESAVGEATPMYLCDKKAPARIAEHLPSVRLIACLRYPTDRAYSHYWMAQGKRHIDLEFREVVQRREERFIERGYYGKQLEKYLSCFGREQLQVLIHEELFANPVQHLNRVCAFLDVDDTFFQNQDWITEAINSSSAVRSPFVSRAIGGLAKWMRDHSGFRQILDVIKGVGVADRLKQANRVSRDYPEMPDALRHKLDELYAPTVQRVEQILGRRVKVWRDRCTAPIPEPSLQ